MLPKSVLACLFLCSVIGINQPVFSQAATDNGVRQVSSLETRFFAHPYSNEALPKRLDRLENFVYGTASTDPLQSRLDKLDNVVPAMKVVASSSVAGAGSAAASGSDSAKRSNALPVADCAWSKTKYPRITELERELLERTFESDAAPTRVARLEEHIFGRVWATQTDLAVRLDRLGEYAFMSPKVEELEKAELLRLSYLQNACYRPEQLRSTLTRTQQVRFQTTDQLSSQSALPIDFQPTQAPLWTARSESFTVVDEIETLEKILFGKISASKPLGQRVDALEVSICGSTQSDKQQNITSRVAVLVAKFSNSNPIPNRSGV
ncbi:MAG: hypothetical protein JST44_19085 [Cyanobacteria bacterium SZAS LIN-5]|nr:hypothetical protein [Cyanobacteria bacterium SZAS LIN-5]